VQQIGQQRSVKDCRYERQQGEAVGEGGPTAKGQGREQQSSPAMSSNSH